jgi:hypothetical protein
LAPRVLVEIGAGRRVWPCADPSLLFGGAFLLFQEALVFIPLVCQDLAAGKAANRNNHLVVFLYFPIQFLNGFLGGGFAFDAF